MEILIIEEKSIELIVGTSPGGFFSAVLSVERIRYV